MTLLLPENLRSVAGLELLARRTAESVLHGLNQSRRIGAGTTFSQYRSYQPGDDLRRLDWKLFARSDRFFVREAEVETNVTVRFLIDASNSMRHENAGRLSKIDYARYVVATIAWLAVGQGDTLALHAFNNQRFHRLDPRPGQHYFQRFLYSLLQVNTEGQFPAGQTAESLLPGSRGREIVIFLTDMHEQADEISATLHRLSRTGHELLLFHLLARNELDLDFHGVLTFEDLESGQRIQADADRIRRNYQSGFQNHLRMISNQMLRWGILYHRLLTDEPAGEGIREFLLKRNKRAF